MHKHAVVLGLGLLGLIAFGAFAGWAVFAGGHIGGGWNSLGPIWPYVVGGALGVAGLTGGLMWLAFYSVNHGYDQPFDKDEPGD